MKVLCDEEAEFAWNKTDREASPTCYKFDIYAAKKGNKIKNKKIPEYNLLRIHLSSHSRAAHSFVSFAVCKAVYMFRWSIEWKASRKWKNRKRLDFHRQCWITTKRRRKRNKKSERRENKLEFVWQQRKERTRRKSCWHQRTARNLWWHLVVWEIKKKGSHDVSSPPKHGSFSLCLWVNWF